MSIASRRQSVTRDMRTCTRACVPATLPAAAIERGRQYSSRSSSISSSSASSSESSVSDSHHFVEQQLGERLAGPVQQHAHRAGVDRLAELLAQAGGQLGRTQLGMIDAVAEHRVIRLARAAVRRRPASASSGPAARRASWSGTCRIVARCSRRLSAAGSAMFECIGPSRSRFFCRRW